MSSFVLFLIISLSVFQAQNKYRLSLRDSINLFAWEGSFGIIKFYCRSPADLNKTVCKAYLGVFGVEIGTEIVFYVGSVEPQKYILPRYINQHAHRSRKDLISGIYGYFPCVWQLMPAHAVIQSGFCDMIQNTKRFRFFFGSDSL